MNAFKTLSKKWSPKELNLTATGALNFLLFAGQEASRWSLDLLKVLFCYPTEINQHLEEAELRRKELNAHPSLWLK